MPPIICITKLSSEVISVYHYSTIINTFYNPSIQRFLTSLYGMTGYSWEGNIGIGSVPGNVWSRSARRKTTQDEHMEPEDADSEDVVKLGFRISVLEEKGETCRVTIEWRIGVEVVLFESFCGKVKSIVQRSHQ